MKHLILITILLLAGCKKDPVLPEGPLTYRVEILGADSMESNFHYEVPDVHGRMIRYDVTESSFNIEIYKDKALEAIWYYQAHETPMKSRKPQVLINGKAQPIDSSTYSDSKHTYALYRSSPYTQSFD